MSGFLHQLAARSLGLTPEIRPRAALPYAAPADEPVTGDGNPVAMPAPLSASPALSCEAPAIDLSPSVRPLLGETPHSPSDLHFAATPTPDTLATKPPLVPAPTDRQPPRLTTMPPTTNEVRASLPRPIIQTPALGEAMPTTFAPAIDRPASPHSASPTPDLASVDLESLVARLVQPQSAAPSEMPADSPTRPVPYTPPLVQPSLPSVPHIPSAVKTASPANTEPAPEVHITIGRLEVNPPPRPAPPPAPRPRGPAPLSLSDYLTRRNGGRP